VNRRDLLGALALGLLWPPAGLQRRPRRARPPWAFRLDGAARWTLAARDGRPVVTGAEIAVAVGGAERVPLAALEGARRFLLSDPGGANAGWQVVGTADGVEVSAQFLDGPPPRITVTARGLGDEQSLEEIRFFDARTAEIPALRGRPTLWINGFLSSDPCRVVVLGPGTQAVSHWSLVTLDGPAARPTAFAFGGGDAGEGRFDCADGHVVAASRFRGRTVGAARPPADATLSVLPTSDPLEVLAHWAGGAAATRPHVPAGWGEESAGAEPTTEAGVLAGLGAARTIFHLPLPFTIRIGDGYQRAAGDWETNDAFPHGHRWLTDRIHGAGFKAGLWLAPFLVGERAPVAAAHPDWLLPGPDGAPLVVAEPTARRDRVYALDAAQVRVRDHLRDLARRAVSEWGYDDLTLDQLRIGLTAAQGHGAMSRSEAFRAAIRAMREGAGRAFVTACDAPLQHTAGLVDAVRVVADTGDDFEALHAAARAVALRSQYGNGAWITDPGPLVVGEAVTQDEARLRATLAALAGGSTIGSEAPGRLSAERLDILQRALPVAPLRESAWDIGPERGGAAAPPSWLLGKVADDWWMLALFNWGETQRRIFFPLADHGIRGPLAVYDVWSEQRRRDVDGAVAVSLQPRSGITLSLRRRRRFPAVVGTSRHVVQGLEVRDERWDPRRRTLAARAVQLDRRPYAVTIALPPGLAPRRASSDPDAGASVAPTGEPGARAVRLLLTAPPGDEVSWEVEFS